MPHSASSGGLQGWRLGLFYLGLAALVVTPILSIQVPLLGDTPNHLARIHILESLRTGGTMTHFYQRPPHLVPYQAMDVVVGWLRPWLPLYAAGRVFLALCLLMPVAAAAALRWAALGRVGLMPAAAFLLSYNYLIARGLLDYLFAAGLAVLLFALWLRLATWPRFRRAALCGLLLAAVFLAHAFAGVAYCILIAGDQLGRAAQTRFQPRRKLLLDWLAAAAQTIPCLILAFGFGATGHFGAAADTFYGTLADKIGAALTPVFFPAPAPIIALFALLPLACLAAAWALRLRIAPPLLGPAIVLAVAAVAAPKVLFNAWATDMRLPILLAILLIAGAAATRPISGRTITNSAAAIALLVALRAGCAFVLLQALDIQAAEVRGLLLALPPGARLLVVDPNDASGPLRVTQAVFTNHAGLLATIDRDAFVPFLLTDATPIVVRPASQAAASPNSRTITPQQLRDGERRQDPPGGPPPYGHGGHIYWLGWPQKFDHVLIMHFGADIGPLPPRLREVAAMPIATLYRVTSK